MKNIRLTIAYDGTNFSGWQRQPGQKTVQGELERVLSVLCKIPITLNGTGRTDAGVHALAQCANFRGDFSIPPQRIQEAANHLLSGGSGKLAYVGAIQILKVEEMPLDFHARFDCVGKKYRYRLRSGGYPDIFQRNQCYQIRKHLDMESMREAAQHIIGTHDFCCFMAAGGRELESTVRTIYDLTLREEPTDGGASQITLEITGNGFLYNMVRIITGTLVEVGLGKKKPEDLKTILSKGCRENAGHTAPPQGLYLAEVYYEKERLRK